MLHDPPRDRTGKNVRTMEEKRLIEEAMLLRSEGEYRKAGKLLQRAMEYGSAEAIYLYGENVMDAFQRSRVSICSTYETIREDCEYRQLRCFKESAERGYPPAMLRLGDLYRDGSSCLEKDLNRAVHWYQRALRQGEHDALARLADPELNRPKKPL